jgi:hypothetical protein
VVHLLGPFQCLSFALVFGACVGCGGAPEPAKPVVASAKSAKKPKPKVKRSLTPEQLQHTMKSRQTAMAACYELSPAKEKELAGELTVDFTVEPSGKVTGESLVNDSIDDKILSECVVGVVRDTSFPSSETAIDVSWPMRFVGR